jgi:hypothetical protein
MEEAKIQFSPTEMELMCNSDILLTKNKVIMKIKKLLESLQEEMLSYAKNHPRSLNNDIFSIYPKISRGENYLGLPYLILDYPRCFQQDNIFTIRTMFWWGNFFSTTLHLSGSYKLLYAAEIEASYNLLENHSIGINAEPWLHHFEKDNYKEIALLDKKAFKLEMEKYPHLKIAKKILLNDIEATKKLFENWKQLIKICFD